MPGNRDLSIDYYLSGRRAVIGQIGNDCDVLGLNSVERILTQRTECNLDLLGVDSCMITVGNALARNV